MDKEAVVYVHNGIFLSHQKRQIPDVEPEEKEELEKTAVFYIYHINLELQ